METKSVEDIKNKILNFLQTNGPSLPVHIARYIGTDMIFTSAFLSELISNQKIKTSWMKVGTSPIYFLPGQENLLEKFSDYVKGKEHEALMKLKKEKFLIDSNEEPAIRIALRSIKDFAKPFEDEKKIIWRYFLVNKEEYKKDEKKVKEIEKSKEIKKEERREKPKAKKPQKRESKAKKTTKQNDEKFFNKVKEYLAGKNIEIEDIVGFNKKDLTLKVKKDGKEILFIAYNKKRLTDKDILDSWKKAEEKGLYFSIFSLGEPTKKIQNFVKASKKLESFERIE